MDEKQNAKERLKEITGSIEQGIKDLFQSDKYQQYLTTMSRFHKYSVNNTMLIYMQKPDATVVAGFNKWRDQFERNVMKGEKGIKIIAPTPYKKKIEQEKLDPGTKLPMMDADGNAITEEKTIQIPLYKVVSVFDVSQTDGKPLPTLAVDLTGNVRNYDVFMEALKRSAPVPIDFENMRPDMDGYFSSEKQRIAIRNGMSEIQTVSAAVHEIAHSKLHNYDKAAEQTAAGDETAVPVKHKSRETEELEAESVSYSVCAYYGIATGENSFGYLASWSKDKELSDLRASLETISKTSSGLITDIDRHYAAIMKERGLDKAEPEQSVTEASMPELPVDYPMPDQTVTIADRNAYGYTENDMLPLSHEAARWLLEQDEMVYMLHPGNGAGMAFDIDDVDRHNGLFGIKREDWEESREYLEHTARHQLSDKDMENSFLNNPTDAYAIYQLKHDDETTELRFMNTEYLKKHDLEPERDNYELIYTDRFTKFEGARDRLEELFDRFNNNRPDDFCGHSLSVSDIVALKQNGEVSYHYVDSWGFKELPTFLKAENYLKSAEMAMEDDYDMIDGIINNGVKQPTVAELEEKASSGQPISLMDLAEASRHEQRPSVLAKLKSYESIAETDGASKRSAEREML